jgi:hypothetical protein
LPTRWRGDLLVVVGTPTYRQAKGLFEIPQLTSDKKPAFGSVGKAPAVPGVAADFRQLLFGNRAALGRRNEKHGLLQITT